MKLLVLLAFILPLILFQSILAQNIIVIDNNLDLPIAENIKNTYHNFNFIVQELSNVSIESLNSSSTIIFLYSNFAVVLANEIIDSNYLEFLKISDYLKDKGYYFNSISGMNWCPWREENGKLVSGGKDGCYNIPFTTFRENSLLNSTSSRQYLFKALKLANPDYDNAQIFVEFNSGPWNPILMRNDSLDLRWYSIVGKNIEEGGGSTSGYPSKDDNLFYTEISITQIDYISNVTNVHTQNSTLKTIVYQGDTTFSSNSSISFKLPKGIPIGDNFYLELSLYQHSFDENGNTRNKKLSEGYLGRSPLFSIYMGPPTCEDFGSYVKSEDKLGGFVKEKHDACITNNALLDYSCSDDGRIRFKDVDCKCEDNVCINSNFQEILNWLKRIFSNKIDDTADCSSFNYDEVGCLINNCMCKGPDCHICLSKSDTKCTDSDGGENHFAKGYVNCNNYIYTDYCDRYSENTLIEYVTDGVSVGTPAFICPKGCVDGVCIK